MNLKLQTLKTAKNGHKNTARSSLIKIAVYAVHTLSDIFYERLPKYGITKRGYVP